MDNNYNPNTEPNMGGNSNVNTEPNMGSNSNVNTEPDMGGNSNVNTEPDMGSSYNANTESTAGSYHASTESTAGSYHANTESTAGSYHASTESNTNGSYTANEEPSVISSLYSYSYVNKEKQSSTNYQDTANNQSYTGNANYQNAAGSQSYTGNANYQNAAGSQNYTGNANYQNAAGSQGSAGGSNNQHYTTYTGPEAKKVEPKKKKNFGKLLAKCAAIAVVFGLVGGTVFYGTGYVFNKVTGGSQAVSQNTPVNNKVTTTSTGTKAVVSDVSEVVTNVMPSIVSITNMSVMEYQGWFGQTYSEEVPSAGSGIIVSQTENELYIVTNNHVVEGASSLTVSFVDDETVTAEIKGTDSSTDLAVITVKVSDIPAETLEQIKVATLGQSGSLKVGEPAIAIGNALGYGQSVTTGVISAIDREVTVADAYNDSITNSLIQTDAAINPGNSGGALLNINGEVIGINSVKYSDTDVEGMGYAIPISTAEPIINDLITKQVVDESESAYLGVAGVDVTDEVSEAYNMPKGIYVAQVTPGSAAEKAGIKQGDIITSFDGREVDSMETLAERMQYYAAGTTVEITIKTAQGGEYIENTISITLGKKS